MMGVSPASHPALAHLVDDVQPISGRDMTDDLSKAVCAALEEIEPGSVATYGDISRRLGISPRQAGREVGRVPDDVPWWRVLRADGTPAACRGGHAAALLESEGVPMREGRVDLARARYEWKSARSHTPT
ncbi:MGMT family protein [Nocardia sp. NPDC058499]|uniref:MGMT family protein n=1 Tax=Nocardia sp. NPDC058499 TaxID=3346530 RepID=UPI003659C42F